MEQKKRPIISIGMIFKNEIRCLERCLISLQPLRDAVPCELVMADTGSDDGSREIAEQYADILFDFPWINDFSAARNAVMDRCSGVWHLSIDADEWIDEDISELLTFIRTADEKQNYAAVTIRNYKSSLLEKGGMYSDFSTARLLRFSTGVRFKGLIHEHWDTGSIEMSLLTHTIFHHDGYVYDNVEFAKQKTIRNMELMKKELAEDPENLLLLMQCIESDGGETPDYCDYVYRAVRGVKEERSGWKLFGAPIMRHAVMAATIKSLPELEEWIQYTEEKFPDSLYTRIDLQYLALGNFWNQERYEEAKLHGEAYFQGVADYEAGRFNRMDIVSSTLGMESAYWKQNASLLLAADYIMLHQPEKCLERMEVLDCTIMDEKQAGDSARNFVHLQRWTTLDIAPVLTRFWEKLQVPEPTAEKAQARQKEFRRIATDVFHPNYRKGEPENPDFCRYGYTAFLPLEGVCDLGDAAAILDTEDEQLLTEKVKKIQDIETFPVYAIAHALEHGVDFPIQQKPMFLEEMDRLILRLSEDSELLVRLALRYAEKMQNRQAVAWARGLLMAAVRSFDWKSEQADAEQGMALISAFVKAEKAFLPRCYTAETLSDQNLFVLPPMHRCGWYCVQAFEALERGCTPDYVKLLKKGLNACRESKDMIGFLLDHTPALQPPEGPQPSDELKSLAEQIRILLAAYPLDDPAIVALKNSEAYQKVAYLIEGFSVPVYGGMTQ